MSNASRTYTSLKQIDNFHYWISVLEKRNFSKIKRCILISLAHGDLCFFVSTLIFSSQAYTSLDSFDTSCFSFQPSGASLHKCSSSSHFPRLREEYRPYLLMYCLCLGGICAVTSAIKAKTSKLLKFSLK